MSITLTTDIGWVYAAEMKGKIMSINPKVNIIDVSHQISPQNVVEGAFILQSVVRSFPKDTIHIGIVDPGVGTERIGIIILCEDGTLIGPDNGLLVPAAERLCIKKVYKILINKFLSEKTSNTFHGRDIFAPVAAYLSKGVKPQEMGKEIDVYTPLEQGEVTVTERRVTGQIIYIDPFGNIITNIPAQILGGVKWNEKVNIRFAGRTMNLKFLKSYGYAEPGEYLLTVSSFDLLEVACNMDNASGLLSAVVGQEISILL